MEHSCSCRGRMYGYILVLGIFMLFAAGCQGSVDEEQGLYRIYYIGMDGSGLITENYKMEPLQQNTVDVIQKLLDQLQIKGNYLNPIQPDVEISNFLIRETQLSIYFTAAYNNKSGIDEILARAAIVKTLCQIPEIDYVEFYVEDQPLSLSGKAVGQMNEDTFVDELNPEFKEQRKQVTLYYSNEMGSGLVEVPIEVTYSAAVPLAQLLLENLITMPEELRTADDSGIISAMPSGTIVNSVTIRDNICYVDLSREFNELLTNVNSDVTVYSIVNTLCELASVSRVQFTIAGEPQEKYGETEHFNTPYERNLDMITEDSHIWITTP